ncbi:ATP-binding protein [Actinomadura monticuli]|uniref:Biotin carboxylase N-terminal domain-containing protein n=1 Tax=Actinomadura monticuli TaxID=3097367 RepID=A0ABV4Q662_9ACTN
MGRTLLIADEGETAVRIARAAAELGWRSLALREMLDERTPHGACPDAGLVLEAAARADAGLVHPGRGALSLDARFARRCARADLTLIGPPPDVLETITDRGRMRALAGAVGVPVPPGPADPVSWEEAEAFLASLRGQAVLLRPASPPGRTGACVVEDPAGLRRLRARWAASGTVRDVYVEEFVERTARVEVQTVGDGRLVAHLWERQPLRRGSDAPRWQAPAAGLPAPTRFLLLDAAMRLAGAMPYRGVSTMTFLLTPTRRFFLTRVDPHLHSGHSVTERLAGLDLFATQLRLARGDTIRDLGLEEHLRPSLPLPG